VPAVINQLSFLKNQYAAWGSMRRVRQTIRGSKTFRTVDDEVETILAHNNSCW